MIYINHATCFIPNTTINVEESAARYNISKAQAKVFSKIYGLERIPVAHNMSILDLIRKPIANLMQTAEVKQSQVALLIHVHTAKVIAPFGETIVQKIKQEFFTSDTLAFSLSINNCASTLVAFDIAKCLLAKYTVDAKAVIVIGERAFTPAIQLIPNTSITGDAAVAVLLSKSGRHDKMLSFTMRTQGKFAKGIWLTPEEIAEFELVYPILLASTIRYAVQKAGITLEKVKVILPHNVNLPSWAKVAKLLDVPLHKIHLNNVKRYAHCFGADVVINYIAAKQAELIVKNDYYVMVTVGLGATFAAAVFQC